MKVYSLINNTEMEYGRFCGVYSTKEKAIEAWNSIDNHNRNIGCKLEVYIIEWELDKPIEDNGEIKSVWQQAIPMTKNNVGEFGYHLE